MTDPIHNRLTELAPRLIAYSAFVHSPEMEREDVQQEMALALLEKSNQDPAFAEQNDSYLTWYATWSAKNIASKSRTYDSHVQEEAAIPDTGEGADMYLALPDDDPAVIVEQRENFDELLSMLSELSTENQTVVKMTFHGYDTQEIAAVLGISSPAVSQRKKTIRNTLKRRR